MLKPSFRIGRSNVLSTNFVPLSCLRCFGVLLKPMCLFPFCFLRNNPDAVTENRPFHELYPFIFVDVLDILTFWEVAYERAVVVVVIVLVVVVVVPMEDRATIVDGGFEAKVKKDDAKRLAMLFSAFPLAVAAPPSQLNNVLVKVAAADEAYDVLADVVAPEVGEEEEEEEERRPWKRRRRRRLFTSLKKVRKISPSRRQWTRRWMKMKITCAANYRRRRRRWSQLTNIKFFQQAP